MRAGLSHTRSIEYNLRRIARDVHQIPLIAEAIGAKGVVEEVVFLVVQFLIMVLSCRMAVEYQMRFSEACRMAVLVVDEVASSFRV